MFRDFQIIRAHNRSQVTAIEFVQNNKLASISHDSTLKIWDLNYFSSKTPYTTSTPQTQIYLNSSYLTSLLIHQSQIIIGNGNGQLTFLDKNNMKPIKIIKIHQDSINSIMHDDNKLITVGSDGKMIQVNLKTYAVQHKVQVNSPLNGILKYKGSIYLSGIKSYSVDHSYKIKKVSNASKFIEHCGRLYVTSDQKGFACASRKFNTYVPCQNMISLDKGILGSSWSTLSFFTIYEDNERISYSSTLIPEISKGDSILSFKASKIHQNRIFCSSQCGNIYTFITNLSYQYL